MFFQKQKHQLNLVAPKELSFRLAQNSDDVMKALKIVYEAYLEKGYCTENEQKIRQTGYHFDANTLVLLALWNNEPVGTVSLHLSSHRTLPMENIFCLKDLRNQGFELAEVGSLAIKAAYRLQHGTVILNLLKFLVQFSLCNLNVTHFVIAINPASVNFYKKVLLFSALSKKMVSSYSYVAGAPAVGMIRNIRTLERDMMTSSKRSHFLENIKNHFFNESLEEAKVPNESINLLMNQFPPYHWSRSGENQRFIIPTNNQIVRVPMHNRFIQLCDLSTYGLKTFTTSLQFTPQKSIVEVSLTTETKAHLLVQRVWQSPRGFTGWKIWRGSENWYEFLKQKRTIEEKNQVAS